MKTIEEVSGKDLRWYFNQAVYGTQVLDIRVLKVSSVPVEWYKEDLKEKKGETQYLDNVWIQRKGEFVIPVDVEIKFDNGEQRPRTLGRAGPLGAVPVSEEGQG